MEDGVHGALVLWIFQYINNEIQYGNQFEGKKPADRGKKSSSTSQSCFCATGNSIPNLKSNCKHSPFKAQMTCPPSPPLMNHSNENIHSYNGRRFELIIKSTWMKLAVTLVEMFVKLNWARWMRWATNENGVKTAVIAD